MLLSYIDLDHFASFAYAYIANIFRTLLILTQYFYCWIPYVYEFE